MLLLLLLHRYITAARLAAATPTAAGSNTSEWLFAQNTAAPLGQALLTNIDITEHGLETRLHQRVKVR